MSQRVADIDSSNGRRSIDLVLHRRESILSLSFPRDRSVSNRRIAARERVAQMTLLKRLRMVLLGANTKCHVTTRQQQDNKITKTQHSYLYEYVKNMAAHNPVRF